MKTVEKIISIDLFEKGDVVENIQGNYYYLLEDEQYTPNETKGHDGGYLQCYVFFDDSSGYEEDGIYTDEILDVVKPENYPDFVTTYLEEINA